MTSPLTAVPESLLEQAYSSGYAIHGALGLGSDLFTTEIVRIIEKHSKPGSLENDSLSFFKRLHTTDLYLAVACAMPSKKAWLRFDAAYRNYIRDLAAMATSSRSTGNDLAGDILSDMFLPDRSGQSRIASYDGQASLATWLRVIVIRRAINERERKWNCLERLYCMPEIADGSGVKQLEARIRSNRYDRVIKDAMKVASKCLNERERLILVLRYEDCKQSAEIAQFLGVHPSTISRQLQQIHARLRDEVIAHLAANCHLGHDAIEECRDEIIENPAYSILSFVKGSVG